MLTGINHITIAVSNLARSLDFYCEILGLEREVTWNHGAYLSINDFWLCLSVENASPARDYSHICFDIDGHNFKAFKDRVLSYHVKTWKENSSEGESLYILDPDAHKLEIHVGSLRSRLEELKTAPYVGLTWY